MPEGYLNFQPVSKCFSVVYQYPFTVTGYNLLQKYASPILSLKQ